MEYGNMKMNPSYTDSRYDYFPLAHELKNPNF